MPTLHTKLSEAQSLELIVKYKTTLPIPSSRVGRSIAIVSKPSRLIERHFPDYCPGTENRAHPQRHCAQCQKLQVSGVLNAVLNAKSKLCILPCFCLWHTQP